MDSPHRVRDGRRHRIRVALLNRPRARYYADIGWWVCWGAGYYVRGRALDIAYLAWVRGVTRYYGGYARRYLW